MVGRGPVEMTFHPGRPPGSGNLCGERSGAADAILMTRITGIFRVAFGHPDVLPCGHFPHGNAGNFREVFGHPDAP